MYFIYMHKYKFIYMYIHFTMTFLYSDMTHAYRGLTHVYTYICINIYVYFACSSRYHKWSRRVRLREVMSMSTCMRVYLTVSTRNATPPKSTESKNSYSSVSRGTNAIWKELNPVHWSNPSLHNTTHSLLHVECQVILFSNLNLIGLFSTEPWQKRPRELDYWLRFEIEEMALQMQ